MNAPFLPNAAYLASWRRIQQARLTSLIAKQASTARQWIGGISSPAVQAAPLPQDNQNQLAMADGATKPGAARLPEQGPEQKIDLQELLDEPTPKAWHRRPAVWLGAACLLLLAAGIWWWLASRAANAAPVFSTQAAALGNVTLKISANGTVQPIRTISIGSELSGTVLKVNVDVNDHVKQGQVMVVLDTSKLHDQILRSQAALQSARANVGLASATIRETRANLKRLNQVYKLSGGKVPSKAELDTASATLARAIANGAVARAGVQDAQAALSTDKINLSKASIRAPADGVVLTRTVDPGNAVAASLQAVTLFTLADALSKLRLWVYVDEADVGSVQVGQSASFTVSAFPNRKFPARITRVGFGSTITDNVVTYLTYLDVDNSDLSLRPGMTATAAIIAAKRDNVLLVPNTALRFTPTLASAEAPASQSGLMAGLSKMSGGNRKQSAAAGASTSGAKQVWVLRDKKPVAVAVTPGISDGRMTEIMGGDLTVGMLVITDQRTASSAAESGSSKQ